MDLQLTVLCAVASTQPTRPNMPGVTDAINAISLVPSHGDDATMRPGIGGHRPGGRHWAREAQLHRRDFVDGAWTAENRTGRTSHEHLPLIFTTERFADEWNGQVWGAHLAWSGNSVLFAEVLPDGRKYIQLGELLHAGESCLEPGESYATPEVNGMWSRSHHPTTWHVNAGAARSNGCAHWPIHRTHHWSSAIAFM